MYELETALGLQVALQVSSLSMKLLQVLAYLERVILRTELFSMSSWQCGACVVGESGLVTYGGRQRCHEATSLRICCQGKLPC